MNSLLESAIEEFDIIGFLEENNIEYSESGENIGADWIGIAECPFCGADLNHFGIHRENKSTNCWKCIDGRGSIIKFIAKVKEISYKEAINLITNGQFLDFEDIETKIESIFKEKQKRIKEIKRISIPKNIKINQDLFNKNHIFDFFKNRRMSLQEVQYYDLRLGLEGNSKNKLIIPIYENKNFVGYQLRSLTGKYYHNEGDIKQYVYDIDQIPKHSIISIVEGFFDLVSVKRFLRFKKEMYVTTPFSKQLTKQQISKINSRNPKKIISFLDRDAWFNYYNTQQEFICDVEFIIPPSDKGDPGNCTSIDLFKLFKRQNLI